MPGTPLLDAVLGPDRPRLFNAEDPLIPNDVWQRSRKVSGALFAINIVRLLVTGV